MLQVFILLKEAVNAAAVPQTAFHIFLSLRVKSTAAATAVTSCTP